MNSPTRQPPRFVPTLTEVVDPVASNPTTDNLGLDIEALIASICQQLQPLIAFRLQQEVEQWLRATLAQQLQEINVRLQTDMESLVRQAVTDALTPQNRS